MLNIIIKYYGKILNKNQLKKKDFRIIKIMPSQQSDTNVFIL